MPAPAPPRPAPAIGTPNLDAEIGRASLLPKPVLLLVAESGLSPADDRALALVRGLAASADGRRFVTIILDISASRNRAAAARYHIAATPALLCLSPAGLILSRDPAPITRDLILNRIHQAAQDSLEVDGQLAWREQAVSKNENDVAARLELADFLLARQNVREAIPHFAAVARSEAADTTVRVRAWVELARARFWIGEPEKGRHEAEDLIAVLGTKTALALSAGNLVLGVQDANAKRTMLARRELEAAISAAPGSQYAKDAAEAFERILGQ